VPCLNPKELLLRVVSAIDAPEHVSVGPFGRHVALKEDVGFAKRAVKTVKGRVCEEIKLALVFVRIRLSFGDRQGY
jgi:hypothetical protein